MITFLPKSLLGNADIFSLWGAVGVREPLDDDDNDDNDNAIRLEAMHELCPCMWSHDIHNS